MGPVRMLTIVGLLSIVLVTAGLVGGRPLEVTVDDDWAGADFDNIQDAIDNTTAGNWIFIHEGLYEENVVVNKSMRLIGNGTNETIVDGGQDGSAIAVRADDVKIENIGMTSHRYRYGILDIQNCSNARAYNCSMNRTFGSDSYGLNLVNVNWSYFDNLYVYRTHNVNLETIDNVTFTNSLFMRGAEVGIQMHYVNGSYFYNCTVNRTTGAGIGGWQVYWNTFEMCDLSRNYYEGLGWYSAENNTFRNTTFHENGFKWDNYDGLSLESCNNNTFDNCSISNHTWRGVYMYLCHDNLFKNTEISESTYDGVLMTMSDRNAFMVCNVFNNSYNGTTLINCNWTFITNCTYQYNLLYGIGLGSSENNTITYNEIIWNDEYGVYVGWDCWNNVIHHNNFLKNHNSPQAADETGNNQWTDGSEGNWWDNWNGTGAYPLDGAGNAEDDAPADDPFPTNAPEKVPEFTVMISLAAMFLMAIVVRRRRY